MSHTYNNIVILEEFIGFNFFAQEGNDATNTALTNKQIVTALFMPYISYSCFMLHKKLLTEPLNKSHKLTFNLIYFIV